MAFGHQSFRRRIINNLDYLFKDTWYPEVLSIFTAWIALATLLFLLGYYFNTTPFTWHSLTLNTWVSIFSTIMKSLLLFTVSACLSQWMYISFSQRKSRLLDFNMYDGASRGLNGSFGLLWGTKFRSIASIGAVITISSLAIDPFVQQVIGLGHIEMSSNTTSISLATKYAKGMQHRLGGSGPSVNIMPTIDFSMQSAITTGLSASERNIQQQVNFKCPSSQCAWTPFLTLGVCSSCNDVSSKLFRREIGAFRNQLLQGALFDFNAPKNLTAQQPFADFELPNGLHLQDYENFTIDMVTFSTSDWNQTITFQHNDTLLWALTVIKRVSKAYPANLNDFFALECGLSYCVQNISALVANSTVLEDSTMLLSKQDGISNLPQTLEVNDNSRTSLWKPNEASQIPDLQLTSNDTKFNVTYASISSIATFLNTTFVMPGDRNLGATGFFMSSLPKVIVPGPAGQNNSTDINKDGQGPEFQPTVMQQLYNTPNITQTFEVLAKSMSINMRNNDDNHTVQFGTISVTVYKVRWGWITLPILSLLVGTVFLVLTMWFSRTKGAPLWKSSALAVLKVGHRIGDVFKDEDAIGAMERRAQHVHVELGKENGALLSDSATCFEVMSGKENEVEKEGGEDEHLVRVSPGLEQKGASGYSIPRFSWESDRKHA
ncbi:hypothetical protein EJ04DRAFT_601070 [Polyplosphaeria fusca]|uniref:Uncharacterized protein n=1 Tax=Polyplosphaeria fusca TaxID=682080 RepID=A0A9P4QYM8_9PLEO|nr:hypothetical protein EJ04DRAFT_601070 [Polyplosphaeria fusca]